MDIITQLNLFEDNELGDLEKLHTVLNELPDRDLIEALDEDRPTGRNDYSNLSMWRAFIAKFVFQHPTIQSLIRELNRNSQLRQMCGFETHYIKIDDDYKKILAPSASAFSRFSVRLTNHIDKVNEIFTALLETLYEELPEFGKHLAVDGKILESQANQATNRQRPDKRSESEATWTAKEYYDKENNVTRTTWYYGYRVHLICETQYELPVAFKVTPANKGESTIAKYLVDNLTDEQAGRGEYLMADRGYDGKPFIDKIERRSMTALIDNRHTWQGGDRTRQYKETDLIYDEDGNVSYVDDFGKAIPLKYAGYDRSTDSLRYKFHPKYNDRRIFRIKRSENVRIFPKVARTSHKYKRLYKERTAVERVNSRLDRDFLFEDHTIRGLDKMNLYISISFIVSLAFASAKMKDNIDEHLASWVA